MGDAIKQFVTSVWDQPQVNWSETGMPRDRHKGEKYEAWSQPRFSITFHCLKPATTGRARVNITDICLCILIWPD